MQAKLILFAVIVSLLGLAGWYYKWSQAEITVLRGNVLTLKNVKALQDTAIKTMLADAKLKSSTLIDVDQQYRESRKANAALRRTLAKHDITWLASRKPGLIQKIINKGSKNATRCLEIVSGAKLTEKEMAASKPSQINKSCPQLANPNYRAKK